MPKAPYKVAADLFARFGALSAIVSADMPELARIDGVGPVALAVFKRLRLLSERVARSKPPNAGDLHLPCPSGLCEGGLADEPQTGATQDRAGRSRQPHPRPGKNSLLGRLAGLCRDRLAHELREQFRAVFIDNKNILLRDGLVGHESTPAQARVPPIRSAWDSTPGVFHRSPAHTPNRGHF